MTNGVDTTLLNSLNPIEIEKYLSGNNWRQWRRIEGEVSVWDKETHNTRFRAWLPLNSMLGDYIPALERFLQTVSLAE